jgi:hypothetical protein
MTRRREKMISKAIPVLLLASLGFVLFTGCVTVPSGDLQQIVTKIIADDQFAKDLSKLARNKAKAELKKEEQSKSAEKTAKKIARGYIPWEGSV